MFLFSVQGLYLYLDITLAANIKTTIDVSRGVVDEMANSSIDAVLVVKKPAQFQNGLTVTGSVSFASGSSPSTILFTATSQAASMINNFTVLADATSQNLTITLPDATLKQGINIFVKKTDATAHTVTILPFGSQTIDGETSQIISSKNVSVQLISYSNWYII